MAQAVATVSEMARMRRTAIDRILNMGKRKLQELLFANTQKMLNNTPLAVREITHRAGLPRL